LELTSEDITRINPFDWESEFPEINGFDAVIGNPPYIRIQAMKAWAPIEVEQYKNKYISASKGNYDIYVVFVEKGLELLNNDGVLGFILPHKFFKKQYGLPLRSIISKAQYVNEIVDFGCQQVFKKATTYTCIFLLNKEPNNKFKYSKVDKLQEWVKFGQSTNGEISSKKISENEWNFVVEPYVAIYEKLNKTPVTLGDVVNIFVGLQTSADKVFIMDLVEETSKHYILKSQLLKNNFYFEKDLLFPLVSGTDIERYQELPERQYILFPYQVIDEKAELIDFKIISEKYPQTADYLLKNKKVLQDREKGAFKDKNWYRFGRTQNLGIQERIKICVPRLLENLYASYDISGAHYLDNVDVGGLTLKNGYENQKLEYVLAILNSKIMRWYFPFISEPFRGCWLSANKQFLSKLPFHLINFDDNKEVKIHETVISLTKTILKLHKVLESVKTPNSKQNIQRQIDATDKQIDKLVYELYGLTEDEIKIVEDSLN